MSLLLARAAKNHRSSGPPPLDVSWDPSRLGSGLTLSNSNKTATDASGTGTSTCVCSTTSNIATDTGGFYFEVVINEGTTSPYMAIGVGASTANLAYAVGQGTDTWGYYQQTGQSYHSNALATYGASYTNADVIGVAVRNGSIYFAKNNVWQNSGDPVAQTGAAFTGLTGAMFAMVSLYRGTSPQHQVTGRFKTADFSYTPPSGYTPWQH